MNKVCVIQVAALGHDFFMQNNNGLVFEGLRFSPLDTVFPALTCTVQASFRTTSFPAQHGIVSNGFFSRSLMKPWFWEQSNFLVQRKNFWMNTTGESISVGQLFWQQSLDTSSRVLLSPAPIHKHHGGMILDCYSRPQDLYPMLKKKIGNEFNLKWYWGPASSIKASKWISQATTEVMASAYAPDFILTYIPHLDYALQKYGPKSEKASNAWKEIAPVLSRLIRDARTHGYELVIFGDYAIMPVTRFACINTVLRKNGLFTCRRVKNMTYPDFYGSAAFAMVDHQIAHVYINKPENTARIKEILENIPGVAHVLDSAGKQKIKIDNATAGDLVVIAESDCWFPYYWWEDPGEAPDYAAHIDIHNKPGYDPCELFFGSLPVHISTNPAQIKGSHGIADKSHRVVWASTAIQDGSIEHLVDLAIATDRLVNRPSKGNSVL
jgi:predicted AlkP superfamily pyrophosphatase or phosphodiesterase